MAQIHGLTETNSSQGLVSRRPALTSSNSADLLPLGYNSLADDATLAGCFLAVEKVHNNPLPTA